MAAVGDGPWVCILGGEAGFTEVLAHVFDFQWNIKQVDLQLSVKWNLNPAPIHEHLQCVECKTKER